MLDHSILAKPRADPEIESELLQEVEGPDSESEYQGLGRCPGPAAGVHTIGFGMRAGFKSRRFHFANVGVGSF
jgi:hypothetical protein